MPNQVITNVEQNFTKGLITEATGLNFPENAATDCDNVEFTLIGDVIRRQGINLEDNFSYSGAVRTDKAINTYKWNNASGDGESQILVQQVGATLSFFLASSATQSNPLSTQTIGTLGVITFTAAGATFDPTLEIQFSDGNGYLFCYHPNCDPFYCTYDPTNAVTPVVGTRIVLQIRDFNGVPEPGVAVNSRPSALSQEHLYNLTNQGWTAGNAYQAKDTAAGYLPAVGVSHTFTVAAGLGATNGDFVQLTYTGTIVDSAGDIYQSTQVFATGTVTGYSGTSLTVLISTCNQFSTFYTSGLWVITPVNHGYISTWFSDVGNYPSNSDQWWSFKDNTDAFNPTATVSNTVLNNSYAPKGHYILNAFQQQRSLISSVTGITDVTTLERPSNGAWFQGRVWYAGVSDQQVATGDVNTYSWTENIYFSQIITDPSMFGYCYQNDDPTSEDLFDLLPTDGGIIQIQGCGKIYRLFPIQNGMLVFAANGIWFITGSQGIGFAANDYTITKISSVQSISSTSYVDVQGLPIFWNEEGIYSVSPSQQGGLTVDPITVGTILSFYNSIPLQSKKYARGSYHPIDYVIQWVFRSENETDVTSRYTFDGILNFNTYNRAFFPYTIPTTTASIAGINYVAGPGGSNSPDPVFKYLVFLANNNNYTFAEENDSTYTDFVAVDTVGVDYTSFFVTGYKLHGGALRRFQLSYINTYSRADVPTSFYIQGIWDYANTGNSGRWSSAQLVNNWSPNFDVIVRRHKIRGQGLVLQLKVTSLTGQPFDLMGWAAFENQNTGI